MATLEGKRKKCGRGQFIRRLSPAAPAHQYTDIRPAHVCACARSPPRYIRLPPGEHVCVDRAHDRRSVGEKYIGASLFLIQVRFSALSPRPLWERPPTSVDNGIYFRDPPPSTAPIRPFRRRSRQEGDKYARGGEFLRKNCAKHPRETTLDRDPYRRRRNCHTLATVQTYYHKVHNYLSFE